MRWQQIVLTLTRCEQTMLRSRHRHHHNSGSTASLSAQTVADVNEDLGNMLIPGGLQVFQSQLSSPACALPR
jgi:hypothetical protein